MPYPLGHRATCCFAGTMWNTWNHYTVNNIHSAWHAGSGFILQPFNFSFMNLTHTDRQMDGQTDTQHFMAPTCHPRFERAESPPILPNKLHSLSPCCVVEQRRTSTSREHPHNTCTRVQYTAAAIVARHVPFSEDNSSVLLRLHTHVLPYSHMVKLIPLCWFTVAL